MKSMFGQARRWASAWALGATLLGSWVGTAAHAAPLYTQAPDPGGEVFLSTNLAQNADSFQLGYAATLNSVRFYGLDIDLSTVTLRLYAGDVVAIPDTYTTLAGTLTRGAVQFQTNILGTLFPVYEFTLALTSAYTTTADQLYYVSIFSTNNWGWMSSAAGDNQSAFRDADGSAWNKLPPDLAFAIDGERIVSNDTPEPASLALVGVALFAAGYARRRAA